MKRLFLWSYTLFLIFGPVLLWIMLYIDRAHITWELPQITILLVMTIACWLAGCIAYGVVIRKNAIFEINGQKYAFSKDIPNVGDLMYTKQGHIIQTVSNGHIDTMIKHGARLIRPMARN